MKSFWEVFLVGFISAIQFHRTVLFVMTSRVTATQTLQCFVLNGVIYLGSIYLYDSALTPLVHLLGEIIQGMYNPEMLPSQQRQWNSGKETVDTAMSVAFTLLWLIPMYILSFGLNTLWYREIAEQVFRQENGTHFEASSLTSILRDEIYRLLLMGWSSLISIILYCIPFLGFFLCLCYTSWIYSFYCFDYKWTLKGWPFSKRLTVFQEHWIYMLGFGMPCSGITLIFPQFIGNGLYAMLFPFCMMLAILSSPVTKENSKFLPRSIRMFVVAEWLNLLVLRLVVPRKVFFKEPER